MSQTTKDKKEEDARRERRESLRVREFERDRSSPLFNISDVQVFSFYFAMLSTLCLPVFPSRCGSDN